MQVNRLTLDVDPSDNSFRDMCGRLGVPPERVTLILPATFSAFAQEMHDKYRCAYVLVAAEMLQTTYTWGVEYHQTVWWSRGVP